MIKITREWYIIKPKRVSIKYYITIEDLISRWTISEESIRQDIHNLKLRAYEEPDFYEDIHDGSIKCSAREYWRYCYWPRDFEFEDATKESLINNNRFISPDTCVTISAYFDVEKCMPSEEEIVFDLNDIIQVEKDNQLITCRRVPVKSRSDLRRDGQYFVYDQEDDAKIDDDNGVKDEEKLVIEVPRRLFMGKSDRKAALELSNEFSEEIVAYVLTRHIPGRGEHGGLSYYKAGKALGESDTTDRRDIEKKIKPMAERANQRYIIKLV